MIFVDANVFMYTVGGRHLLQDQAREFLIDARRNRTRLFTSAEVLQELLHVYFREGRLATLDKAMELISIFDVEVWPLEEADVREARRLQVQHPNLQARDLCHLASCQRRGVVQVKTFDRALAAAANPGLGNQQ